MGAATYRPLPDAELSALPRHTLGALVNAVTGTITLRPEVVSSPETHSCRIAGRKPPSYPRARLLGLLEGDRASANVTPQVHSRLAGCPWGPKTKGISTRDCVF